MNRSELVKSLNKKGFRPDGKGGFTKEPTNKSDVNENGNLDAEVSKSLTQSDAREALGATPRNERGGKGRIVVRFTRRASRCLDADNLAGGFKLALDQLRYAGILPEDNPEVIDLQFSQEKVRKEEEGTLIEITYP